MSLTVHLQLLRKDYFYYIVKAVHFDTEGSCDRQLRSITCWKKQNTQQHGIVWTTSNYLPVVYTLIKS